MIIYKTKEMCSGCTACALSCPTKAITMSEDVQGFLYPEVNEEKCIDCGICKKVCPFIKRKLNSNLPFPTFVAVMNKSEKVRNSSTSGGFFYSLADYVLSKQGVVYGAAFSENFIVRHIRGTSYEDIKKMQGSKYVQSDLGYVYKMVKEDLNNKKLVLFTGCPCQVDGLNNYLQGKKPDNLILCDLICHGTPSPRIWKDYLIFIQKKYKDKIEKIKFRDKCFGWHTPTIHIKLTSSSYTKTCKEDIFYQIFYSSCALRPSCYHCQYANLYKISDLTIGDFWGIERLVSQFDDNKGTSLVLLNTVKGKYIFKAISGNFNYQETEIEKGMQENLKEPTVRSKYYQEFWRDYERKGLLYISKKYLGYGITGNIKRILKKMLRKIYPQI